MLFGPVRGHDSYYLGANPNGKVAAKIRKAAKKPIGWQRFE